MMNANRPYTKNGLVAHSWQDDFQPTNACVILCEQSDFDGPLGWSQTNDAFSRQADVSRRNRHLQRIVEYLSGDFGSGSGISVAFEIAEESSQRCMDPLEEEYREVYGRCHSSSPGLGVTRNEIEATAIEHALTEPVVVQAVADIVAEVRERLSLSITELAAILSVGRPTIYAWLRGDSDPHQRNLDRLEYLKGVSADWWALAGRPLYRHLRHSFDKSGRTLFSMLKANDFDPGQIRDHLETLAQLPEKRPVSVKELASKHGILEGPKSDSEGDREMAVTKRFATDVDAADDQR